MAVNILWISLFKALGECECSHWMLWVLGRRRLPCEASYCFRVSRYARPRDAEMTPI